MTSVGLLPFSVSKKRLPCAAGWGTPPAVVCVGIVLVWRCGAPAAFLCLSAPRAARLQFLEKTVILLGNLRGGVSWAHGGAEAGDVVEALGDGGDEQGQAFADGAGASGKIDDE